jgi:hypothetical protein
VAMGFDDFCAAGQSPWSTSARMVAELESWLLREPLELTLFVDEVCGRGIR